MIKRSYGAPWASNRTYRPIGRVMPVLLRGVALHCVIVPLLRGAHPPGPYPVSYPRRTSVAYIVVAVTRTSLGSLFRYSFVRVRVSLSTIFFSVLQTTWASPYLMATLCACFVVSSSVIL